MTLVDYATRFPEAVALPSIETERTTSPYHPMANGLMERLNGTLKKMLRRMCTEEPKDWDRFIEPLLFAHREVSQAITGFSPLELLYGRNVQGPLTILKELWTGDKLEEETKTAYQYVIGLRERPETTCQMALEALEEAVLDCYD
ncbi:uncharacterized protein LOC144134162 [Amblyomma americanum]